MRGHDTRALQDWLGHRSIQHTVRYTELSPTRFKDFWRDQGAIIVQHIRQSTVVVSAIQKMRGRSEHKR
jgi:hypothetical protein